MENVDLIEHYLRMFIGSWRVFTWDILPTGESVVYCQRYKKATFLPLIVL